MKFECIFAHTNTNGIGTNGKLPWSSCKKDMDFFRKTTLDGDNAIVMGSTTWKSIGRALPGRLNVVISSTLTSDDLPSGVCLYHNIPACIRGLLKMDLDRVFIIGGASIYKQFFDIPIISKIYANEVVGEYKYCDTFITNIPNEFQLCTEVASQMGDVIFRTYERKRNSEEDQYLDLIRDILENGDDRMDRTGTGTLSLFSKRMVFSLRDGKIPLLTTKRVFWRGVVEELLWIISGSTDAKVLSETGVRIWDDNGSRGFLDNLGFTGREVGDLGPVYGFQWRFSGAEYVDCKTDYSGQGIDQLAECINKIKNDPGSRRIIISAWNPFDMGKMALPPCHMSVQFYVSKGELSCQMYQRSADVCLGVPFNIASYSLLTHMIAQVCGLKAKEFIHIMGDAHIYKNHIEGAKAQLERDPLEFPIVKLNSDVKNIDDFIGDDVILDNYFCHPTIKLPFSA